MEFTQTGGAPSRSPSWTAPFAATRPHFLGLALVAALLGLAAAAHEGVSITGWTALLSVIGALLAHAGANALNDYYDHLNGSDRDNPDRVPPFTGGSGTIQAGQTTPALVARTGWGLFGMAAVIGGVLLVEVGPGLLLFGLAGLLLGWLYSTPPLFLAGRGWGEITVGVAFGLLIPAGTAFVQTGSASGVALAAGLPLAVLTAAILYINQFPDYAADHRTGKRNWVVRLGPRRAWPGYPLLAATAAVILAAGITAGPLPAAAWWGLLPMALHTAAAGLLAHRYDQPPRLRPALAATVAGTLLYAVVVAAALVLTTV